MANMPCVDDAYWQCFMPLRCYRAAGVLENSALLTYRGDKSRERYQYKKNYCGQKNALLLFFLIMFDDIFTIKFARIKVSDWERKKNEILKNAGELIYEKHPKGEFLETNFSEYKDEPDRMNVRELLEDELSDFMLTSGARVLVNGSWLERSTKGMSHSVHNHGALGYSAACYVCYDSEVHTPTQFIAPFNNSITGMITQYEPDDIVEGDLILFPSYLHHYTKPNLSDKERIVLSFNLHCITT